MKTIARIFLVLCIFGVMACSVSTAMAGLRLEVENIEWKGNGSAGYSAFSPEEQIQTVRIRVRSTEATPFFITFGGSTTGGGRRKAIGQGDELEFFVCASATRRTPLKDLASANPGEILRDAFALRETEKELTCVLIIPASQMLPAGRYTHLLQINLYKGTPEKSELSDSKSVVVSIPVQPVTELSLAPAGAGFDANATLHKLDFGRLARGKSLGLDLRVRSNAGYSITMESENQGRLKNIDERDGSTLPYEFRIAGKPMNLSGQLKLSRTARVTDSNGDRHDLQISIPDLNNATAGTYRDNIIITVTSEQ